MLSALNPNARVLLIEPPFYRFFGYERWYYPITLTLVATYLEEMGYYARVFDADQPSEDCRSLSRAEVRNTYYKYEEAIENLDHPIWREVTDFVRDFQPDVVGLTSVSAKIDSADIIARMVKKEYGNSVMTLLGGPHVQGMRSMYPGCDFDAAYDLIVERISGLANRKPNRNLIINHERYSPSNFASMLTSVGCPNTCAFCCHSYEKKMLYKSYDCLKEEIEELRRDFHKGACVGIMDDCIFANRMHFSSVLNLLAENDLAFTAGARLIDLSPEKLELISKKGGKRIHVGVESGSQRVLDRIRKRLTLDTIMERTAWLNDSGIAWSAFFLTGFPFETLDDIRRTEELIYKIRPGFVSLNRFAPYPGTELCREYFPDLLNSSFRFRNLFQLSPNSNVVLSDDIAEYIAKLYVDLDIYNRENNKEHTD